MNKTVLRINMRQDRLFFWTFTAILWMYSILMVDMFDPEALETFSVMMKAFPDGLAAAIGYDQNPTDLVSFVGLYLFQFIFLFFPLIYVLALGNRLVAKHTDTGSLANFLATPLKRGSFISTQGFFLLGSTTLLMAIQWATLFGVAEAKFPGALDIPLFLMLCAGCLLLLFALSAISFFFSVLCNDAKFSLALGAGIPILFYLMDMLGKAGDTYSILRNITPLRLFDVNAILAGEPVGLSFGILGAITVVLYGLGAIIFSKKNLVI